MSSNQRPTAVRVLSSQGRLVEPTPRRGAESAPDTPAGNASAIERQAAADALAQAQSGGWGRTIGLLLLFLIGCALGGAVLTLFGLGAR